METPADNKLKMLRRIFGEDLQSEFRKSHGRGSDGFVYHLTTKTGRKIEFQTAAGVYFTQVRIVPPIDEKQLQAIMAIVAN